MKRLLSIWMLLQSCCIAQVTPLSHGHAHNDYVHTRPLFEALENGFASIEIDVYLHQGELKVAHLPFGLDKKKNIQQLYLDPIKKVIEENGGNVYRSFSTPVIFMIDFKTGSSETYVKLKEILKNYESMITVYKGDSVIHQRGINILITGDSPVNAVLKEDSSVVTIDGNINGMNNTAVNKVTTRYSSVWENYFSWTGNGIISATEKAKLDSLVAKAHEKKKQIRFYHIPDKPNVWENIVGCKGRLDKYQ